MLRCTDSCERADGARRRGKSPASPRSLSASSYWNVAAEDWLCNGGGGGTCISDMAKDWRCAKATCGCCCCKGGGGGGGERV